MSKNLKKKGNFFLPLLASILERWGTSFLQVVDLVYPPPRFGGEPGETPGQRWAADLRDSGEMRLACCGVASTKILPKRRGAGSSADVILRGGICRMMYVACVMFCVLITLLRRNPKKR